MVFLFLAAVTTAYTARLLAKCMDLDASLITFSDIAYHSFGSRARLVTSVLFTLELVAACVALIVLFADSLRLLFPGFLSTTEWKVFCFFVLIPLSFLPMRLLSYTSLLGIVACLSSESSSRPPGPNICELPMAINLGRPQLSSSFSLMASSNPRHRAR